MVSLECAAGFYILRLPRGDEREPRRRLSREPAVRCDGQAGARDRGCAMKCVDFDPTDCAWSAGELARRVNERTRIVAVGTPPMRRGRSVSANFPHIMDAISHK